MIRKQIKRIIFQSSLYPIKIENRSAEKFLDFVYKQNYKLTQSVCV